MTRTIMILFNPFRPDPRVYREARALVTHNVGVTLCACDAWHGEHTYPRVETVDGIDVKRVKIRLGHVRVASFVLTLTMFWLFALLRILAEKPDVIHCHDFDTLPVGVLARTVTGIPLIFDSHEYYPSMVSRGIPKIMVRALRFTHRILSSKADAIVVVNDEFRRFFGNGIIVSIMNVPMKAERNHPTVRKEGSSFEIFYYGVLAEERGVTALIRIAMEIPDLALFVAGDGPLKREVQMAGQQRCNIQYMGWISEDEISARLCTADLVPILYDPTIENNRLAAPGKLFQAMAKGVPVLAYKDTFLGKLIGLERCGIAVKFGDNDELVKAILMLRDDENLCNELSRNALTASSEKYTWEIMEQRLVSLYRSLLNG
jgi:glycosyltransferase involved in cell wall biosynthesis